MIRFLLLFVCVVGAASAAKGQQLSLYSQFSQNRFLLNPAAAGSSHEVPLQLGSRQQWVGFEGAPSTFYLSGHYRFANLQKDASAKGFHAAGGVLYNDQVAFTNRVGLNASYAYHARLGDDIWGAAGASVGGFNYHVNMGDAVLANNSKDRDPVTNKGNISTFSPDFSVGLYAHGPKWYGGLSMAQVYKSRLSSLKVDSAKERAELFNHFFAIAGYRYALNPEWVLEPNAQAKFILAAPLQLDFNLLVRYRFNQEPVDKALNSLMFGAGFRTQDAVPVFLGASYGRFSLTYSYDILVSDFREAKDHTLDLSTHEINIGYRIGREAFRPKFREKAEPTYIDTEDTD